MFEDFLKLILVLGGKKSARLRSLDSRSIDSVLMYLPLWKIGAVIIDFIEREQ